MLSGRAPFRRRSTPRLDPPSRIRNPHELIPGVSARRWQPYAEPVAEADLVRQRFQALRSSLAAVSAEPLGKPGPMVYVVRRIVVGHDGASRIMLDVLKR
jgi:hypothetical protein